MDSLRDILKPNLISPNGLVCEEHDNYQHFFEIEYGDTKKGAGTATILN